jgi:hypothetical protein
MALTPTTDDGIPAGAEQALKNKITQITSSSGLGSMNDYAQFCLVVSVDAASKEVVPGAPPKFVETLDFNFYIVDQFDKKVFASTSVTAKGLGNSESRAYIQAISNVAARSPQLTAFVNEGRDKIVQYYTENCGNIIAKSYGLAKLEKYDEALFYLGQIPEAAGECYLHAIAATSEIYNLYLDRQCSVNLGKAKAAWNASPNAEGGLAAGLFLAGISPEANCFAEAEALFAEIKAEVKDDKMFDRNMEIDRWEHEKQQWRDTVDVEKQSVEAARQIGIAWGEHQQPATYREIIGR